LAACVAMWDGSEESEFAPSALDRAVRCYAPRTQKQVSVLQLRRLLLLGRIDDAKDFACRHMLMSDAAHPSDGPVGEESLLELEWSWTVGQKRGLPDRIERFRKQIQSGQRWRELLQVHLLEIDIHTQSGDNRRAQRSLAQALFVAARRRLIQPMVDRMPQLKALLSQVTNKDLGLVQPEEIDLLTLLTELAGGPVVSEKQATDACLADPMTRRERELLDLLDKGLSNQQIADRVNLSVPTVKWHFYKLFAKLQVKNRAAALAKARSLSLLR
jgi:LuxR family transcriptional regulator, maltose regulon positive regulatory protein